MVSRDVWRPECSVWYGSACEEEILCSLPGIHKAPISCNLSPSDASDHNNVSEIYVFRHVLRELK
jgi:hypothetical protein